MTPEQQAEASYMAWLNDNSNFAAPAPSLSVASQAGVHPNNFVDVRYADTPRVDYPVPTGPQPRTQYYGGNTYGPLGPLGVDPRTIGHVSAHNDPYHSTMSAVTVNGSVGPVVSYASRDPHVLWAPEVPDAYVLLNQALAAGRRDPDPRMFDLLAGLMKQQPAPRQGGGAPAPAAVTKAKQNTTAAGNPALKEGSAEMQPPMVDTTVRQPATPVTQPAAPPVRNEPLPMPVYTDSANDGGAGEAYTINGDGTVTLAPDVQDRADRLRNLINGASRLNSPMSYADRSGVAPRFSWDNTPIGKTLPGWSELIHRLTPASRIAAPRGGDR